MTKERERMSNMSKEENSARAFVQDVDGKLLLTDPDAVAMARAVAKHNCRTLFDLNADRVSHFAARMKERGDDPKVILIVLINVDDIYGAPIADALMPGHDWQAYRDRGELPVARGLAGRNGIQGVLDEFDEEAGNKLRKMDGIAVVVVDHRVAEIFQV
jgi:hypothetical protein